MLRSHVIIFQPRFAPLVESGVKPHTIRPVRKRAIKVGDALDLRAWMGKPYRSKQRKLRVATCTDVRRFRLEMDQDHYFFWLDSFPLVVACAQELARLDGFGSGQEMAEWFAKMHGLPFEGLLIEWSVV